jgi:MinD-like ATPase involved in chromosome partitioning or flagellar assembly
VEQGEQEYPPGTVGYLAQGLGWRTASSRDLSEEHPVLPEARRATPVPEDLTGDGDPGDVHTDEDDDPIADFFGEPRGGVAAHVRNSLFDDGSSDFYDDSDDLFDRLLDDPDADLSFADPDLPGPRLPDEGFAGAGLGGPVRSRGAGERVVEQTQPVPEPLPPSEFAELADFGRSVAADDPGVAAAAGDTAVSDQAVDAGQVPAAGEPTETAEPVHPDSDGFDEPLVGPEPVRGVQRQLVPEQRSGARWIEPGALAAQQAQRERNGELVADPELATARLLRQGRRPPRSGWRRMLYLISGQLINVGEGRADLNERELIARINRPLHGCYRIAMLSLKGGVGKTTVTATVGATFASLRGDRVIAVDANPDRGTLSQKIPLETSATVRHLLRDATQVRRYTDVRAYTSQGPSRLEVLASEQDPAVSEAFSEAEYRRTVNLLEHFYNVVLTDCGTGLMHSAMYGVLGLADALVIVSSGSIDGARSASATMDWLDAHGHRDLVANSVAVINSVRRNSGGVDLDRVAEHFAARCRAVVRVPYDSHLEEGAEIDLDRLSVHTRGALLELAASVADGFPAGPEAR